MRRLDSGQVTCRNFDCLARDSNQKMYQDFVDQAWTYKCIFDRGNKTFYHPCNDTSQCVYLPQSKEGICITYFEINNLTTLYPGDKCPVEWYEERNLKCRYGKMQCENGLCLGFKENEVCSRSQDCEPGFYCSERLVCTPQVKAGEDCSHDDHCSRTAKCIIKNSSTNSRVCVEYFSLSDGEKAYSVFSNGKVVLGDDFSPFICSSGYANPRTGLCTSPPTSNNKGNQCSSNSDCPSSIEGLFANCDCVMGKENERKCGVLEGDSEGKEEIESFKAYIQATKSLRKEHQWNPEDDSSKESYFKYRCARLKRRAKTAIDSRGFLDCIDKEEEGYNILSKSLPFFGEYAMFCGSTLTSVSLALLLSLLVVGTQF